MAFSSVFKRRIALFNDTGMVAHVGCLAVSDAHAGMLANKGIEVRYRFFANECKNFWTGDADDSLVRVLNSPLAENISAVDAVVVNGEGTIHHSGGRHLLTILTAAQKLSIPTFLVNAVIQASETHLETLRQLSDFTVRDACSSRYLNDLKIPHRLVMDSILESQFSTDAAHDFSGKVIITDHHHERDDDVGVLLRQIANELGEKAVYYPLNDPKRRQDWRHAVADFRAARVIITARHHGVYLAGLAGVPFVAFGSNTWKIEGLLAMFGQGLRVCTNLSQLREACRTAPLNPNLFAEFHHFLLNQRPLSTFEQLAGSFQR